jgi:hypothetical protein
LATLSNLYAQHRGRVCDKWSLYLRVYEDLFESKRSTALNLLEIGVQNGGSLELWAQYLPNAEHLVGCDINPECGTLFFDDPRISVVVGDANADEAFESIKSICQSYDVIIDDGSHVPRDVVTSFLNYFPMLSPGGTYVVEDVHCDYLDSHVGGILQPFTAGNFFHCVVQLMNQAHWSAELAPETFASGFIPRESFPQFLKQRWIDSITFYDSMIIARRAVSEGAGALGRRVIVGEIATVCADPVLLRERLGSQ